MMSTKRSLVMALALTISAGGFACSSDDSSGGNSGGAGGSGGSTGGRGGSGGSGGSTGGSGGSTGGSGGSTGGSGGSGGSTGGSGGSGGSTGGSGGSGGSTGGSGGSGGSTGGSGGSTGGSGGSGGSTGGSGGSTGGSGGGAGDGGMSEGGTSAKVALTVTGFTMMGTRNCYPAGSNSMGNKSPKLDWGPAPTGIKSWVLSTEDITGRSVHQIVCKIMPSVLGQPADVKTMVPAGAEFGVGHGNKANVGWYGPGAGGAARNYEIRIWALAVDAPPMSCKTDPKGALAYLKMNRMNKAVVLDTDGKDFWGNVDGNCN